MKKISIILLFLSLFLINCVHKSENLTIDFNNFDNEIINRLVFDTLNTYNRYNIIDCFSENEKIYEYIKENCDNISIDSLITKINNEILGDPETIVLSSAAIINCISCTGIKRYDEIVKQCFDNWSNPSDMLFITSFGTNVGLINYYNKKTNMIYICCVLK